MKETTNKSQHRNNTEKTPMQTPKKHRHEQDKKEIWKNKHTHTLITQHTEKTQ
jgi:hypothetical protein